jgi:hypothetical protein
LVDGKSQDVSSETGFYIQSKAWNQERGLENSTLEGRGSMQGPTLRKAAHLQLSSAARGGRDRPAIPLATEKLGHDLVHRLRSTIAFGQDRPRVSSRRRAAIAVSLAEVATKPVRSEQTFNNGVRHQLPSRYRPTAWRFAWEAWYRLPTFLGMLACSLARCVL